MDKSIGPKNSSYDSFDLVMLPLDVRSFSPPRWKGLADKASCRYYSVTPCCAAGWCRRFVDHLARRLKR
jgi:hypothetical protein